MFTFHPVSHQAPLHSVSVDGSLAVRREYTSHYICLPWGIRCLGTPPYLLSQPLSLMLPISLACSPSSSVKG